MSIISRQTYYSDLDFTLRIGPNTGDVVLKKDAAAVKQSIINILMTRKGERPFNPVFGGNLQAYLFENFDNILAVEVENQIRNTIENFEPRAKIKEVRVSDLSYRNALSIWMEVEIRSPDVLTTEIEFIVERLR